MYIEFNTYSNSKRLLHYHFVAVCNEQPYHIMQQIHNIICEKHLQCTILKDWWFFDLIIVYCKKKKLSDRFNICYICYFTVLDPIEQIK